LHTPLGQAGGLSYVTTPSGVAGFVASVSAGSGSGRIAPPPPTVIFIARLRRRGRVAALEDGIVKRGLVQNSFEK